MSSRWHDRLRYALTFRLAAWYAVLFIASVMALFALTYILLARSLQARDHDIIRSTLQRYAADYQLGGFEALNRSISADRVSGRHESLFVRVMGRGAEAVFFNVPGDWGGVDLSRLERGGDNGETNGDDGDSTAWTNLPSRSGRAMLEVASIRLIDGTLFQVGKSSESRDELLWHFRSRALILLFGVMLTALAGGVLLTYGGLRPLRELTGAVRTIVSTGRLDTRVPVRATEDPLDELGGLVNGMLDRIETLVDGMRGALDNVAHDLRTPLARLRSVAETGLRAEDPEAAREALTRCLEESERVAATLTALMDISEAETGTLALGREIVPVGPVVRDALDLYSEVAEEKGVGLEAAGIADDLRVLGDPARLRQVLANLVDNAIKYTPAGGRVDVAADADEGGVVIRVSDSGIGIAPDEAPRVWDRLYRGDRSRSERGLGLGLSLVKAIVEAHGGSVALSSTVGQGSTFTIRLPAPTRFLTPM
jgi:signal transduction histidine kinase